MNDPQKKPSNQAPMASSNDSDARDGQNRLWMPQGSEANRSHMNPQKLQQQPQTEKHASQISTDKMISSESMVGVPLFSRS